MGDYQPGRNVNIHFPIIVRPFVRAVFFFAEKAQCPAFWEHFMQIAVTLCETALCRSLQPSKYPYRRIFTPAQSPHMALGTAEGWPCMSPLPSESDQALSGWDSQWWPRLRGGSIQQQDRVSSLFLFLRLKSGSGPGSIQH